MMFKSGFGKFAAPCLLIVVAAVATPSVAMIGDTVADTVFGQLDFVHNLTNTVTAGNLLNPISVEIDESTTPNRIYVVDMRNSRVLAWNDVTSFSNGSSADLVIGQPDFVSATCNNGGLNANSLCFPVKVAVDGGGNLYVADKNNSRVLEYNTALSTDTIADRVFGQGGSFISSTCNNHGLSANSLCQPTGVAVDGAGNLYVADDNSRVLEYNTPLTTDTTADHVFGQGGSFTSNACDNGGLGASSLCDPQGITVDAGGNLYVADLNDNRVLEYDTPLSTDTAADRVFGQPDFISISCNNGGASANSLCAPTGIGVDAVGNVYVADAD